MSQTAASTMAGTYIYGIADAGAFSDRRAPLETRGIGGKDDVVRTIQYQDLVALVSNSPRPRNDISRENLLAHQSVLEEAMTRTDVLPVAFDTVASSDQAVEEQLLKREFDDLRHQLERLRGRVELDLKVLWDEAQLFQEIVEEDDQIRGLRDAIQRRSSQATYYDRITLGQLTEAAVKSKSEQETDTILRQLQPLAAETRVNENLTNAMILNAAFLVDKDQIQTFDDQVEQLGQARLGRLKFRYVGPLPPYNFVNLRVRWED